MTENERIVDCFELTYRSLGYIDVNLASKMLGVPSMVLENVLKNEGYKESGIKGQWIK